MTTKKQKATKSTRRPFYETIRGRPGRYQRILTSNSTTLIAALNELPGFTEIDDTLHRWGDVHHELLALATDDDSDPAATYAARLTAGDEMHATDVLTLVDDAVHRAERRTAAFQTDDAAGQLLTAQRDRIIEEGTSRIASSLTAMLNALLENMRASGVGIGDVDAKAAIDTGRVDEHRQLDSALEAYMDIRTATTAVLNDNNIMGGADFWAVATVGNLLELDPLWAVRRLGMAARNVETGEVVRVGEELVPDFGTEDQRPALAWLADHLPEVTVRVPTPNQFRATQSQLAAARSAALSAADPNKVIRVVRGNEYLGQRKTEVVDGGPQYLVVDDNAKDAKGADVWQLVRPTRAFA